jgi:YQGE family putative transporter
MDKIIAIFRNETTVFSNSFSLNAKRVLRSNLFYTISSALISVFISAFIWRITDSLVAVTIYNLAKWLFLPVAFYWNGLLLRKISIQNIFFIGAMLSGISSILLVLFGSSNLAILFVYGALWGIGNGFYWANRNYLEFNETMTDARQYFYGVMSSISGISSIVIPFLAGWFIVFAQVFKWFSIVHAYWIIFGLAFLCMAACGYIIKNGNFVTPTINSLYVKKLLSWNKRRILNIVSGLVDGTYFVSTLLILVLFKNEGGLGTVTAIVSIIGILATYIYGRIAIATTSNKTMVASIIVFFISTLSLVVLRPLLGIGLFIIVSDITATFFSIASMSVIWQLVEEEEQLEGVSRWAFIVDNELFMNVGRMIAIGVLLGLVAVFSQKVSLFYGQLVIAFLQLFFVSIFFIKKK